MRDLFSRRKTFGSRALVANEQLIPIYQRKRALPRARARTHTQHDGVDDRITLIAVPKFTSRRCATRKTKMRRARVCNSLERIVSYAGQAAHCAHSHSVHCPVRHGVQCLRSQCSQQIVDFDEAETSLQMQR